MQPLDKGGGGEKAIKRIAMVERHRRQQFKGLHFQGQQVNIGCE